MASIRDVPDSELLKRAVKSCRPNANKGVKHPRWVAVMQTFGLGSTYAAELCLRFELDPDEMVSR